MKKKEKTLLPVSMKIDKALSDELRELVGFSKICEYREMLMNKAMKEEIARLKKQPVKISL